MLEWVSIYWHSRAGPAASLRIYKELSGGNAHHVLQGTKWTSVPFGLARFPKELEQMPRR